MFFVIHSSEFIFKRPVDILDRMLEDTVFCFISSFEVLNLLLSAVHNLRSCADDRESLDVLVEGFKAGSALLVLSIEIR